MQNILDIVTADMISNPLGLRGVDRRVELGIILGVGQVNQGEGFGSSSGAGDPEIGPRKRQASHTDKKYKNRERSQDVFPTRN